MQRFVSGMLAICAVAAALSTTGETADADQPPHDDHPHYLFLARRIMGMDRSCRHSRMPTAGSESRRRPMRYFIGITLIIAGFGGKGDRRGMLEFTLQRVASQHAEA